MIIAMQSELYEYERIKVWDLVEKPQDDIIIGTWWIFSYKHNKDGEIIIKK